MTQQRQQRKEHMAIGHACQEKEASLCCFVLVVQESGTRGWHDLELRGTNM